MDNDNSSSNGNSNGNSNSNVRSVTASTVSSTLSSSSSSSRDRRETMLLNLVGKDARRYWSTLPSSLQKSKEFILQALTKSKTLPSKTEFERKWDINLRQDRDVVLAWAVRPDFVHNFHERHLFLPGPLGGDKDVIMAYCRKIPRSLQEASDDLCDDRDVVEAAIQCNGLELQYGSLRLQQDYDLVKKACISNGEALVLCPYGCETRRRLLEDAQFMHDVVLSPKFATEESKSRQGSSQSNNKKKRRRRDLDGPAAGAGVSSSSSPLLYTYHTTTSDGAGRIWKMIPRHVRFNDRRLVLQALKSGLAFRDVPSDMLYLKQQHDNNNNNMDGSAATTTTNNNNNDDRPYDIDFVKTALTGNPALYLQFPPRLCETHHPELALHTLRSVRTFMDEYYSEGDDDNDTDTSMEGNDGNNNDRESAQDESNSNRTNGQVGGGDDGDDGDDEEADDDDDDDDGVDVAVWCRDVIVKAFQVDRVASESGPRLSSSLLQLDRDAVLVVCKYGSVELLEDILAGNDELIDDLEVMKHAVRRKPSFFNHVSDRLKQVPEIIMYSVTPVSAYDTLRSLSPTISQEHPEIVVKCIETSVGTNLRHLKQYIPAQVWADHRDVSVAWIRRKCSVSSVPNLRQMLQNDHDLALELAEYNWEEMRQVGHAMLNDKSFMLRAVERDGRVLCYAEEATRNDFDLLLIALSRHGTQREYTTKPCDNGGANTTTSTRLRRQQMAAAAPAADGNGGGGGGNQDRARAMIAVRQARMEQRQRALAAERRPRSPPSVHSVFGYMCDICGFERKVREKLDLHNGFMYNFLGGISCIARQEQRQPPAQRSQLPMLDRGADTSRAFKQLIAEFCGVPIGKELKQLRQAQVNLNRRRRPNETVMHARPVPVPRPGHAARPGLVRPVPAARPVPNPNRNHNIPPAAAGPGFRFGGMNLALDDDDDDGNDVLDIGGLAGPALEPPANRRAAARARARARLARDNADDRRNPVFPMRQPPAPLVAPAAVDRLRNADVEGRGGGPAANMLVGQGLRAEVNAGINPLRMVDLDVVVAGNAVVGPGRHENPLAILEGLGDEPVGPVRQENPLAIGDAPERNVRGNANLDNVVVDLNADLRAARREREEVEAERASARQLRQQQEDERRRRIHQQDVDRQRRLQRHEEAIRNRVRPPTAAAVMAAPAPPVGRVEPAPPIAANMRMADLDEYMERANELARQRDEYIRHLGRDDGEEGAARRRTRQQRQQQQRQEIVAGDVNENSDDEDEEDGAMAD
eukprot:CAMPEP_0113447106 /NCGR_PEP_ID=MMETSP0014_2-20120614/4065_1 /TAXON_ID=2857 /ORGANISM="Nitzschia sp." /LENGTH=1261 /DNA_ID=CAMNT_0000338247 /DNA_START=522 /DNA_END=4307 /DNA_ORIENTATION=+ /assembly_acc=CAM_ASM_000159